MELFNQYKLSVTSTPRREEVNAMTVRPVGQIEIKIDPSAPKIARRWVRTLFASFPADGLVLVSELVTNAVVHGRRRSRRQRIRVQLGWDDKMIKVQVTNPCDRRNPRTPKMRKPGIDAQNGRGLLLLDAMSHRWGWDKTGGDVTVWFEIEVGP
jgi:anti-sigma regulatory factor (Ser/Thr protein kinase)